MKRWQKILIVIVGVIAALWGAHAFTYPTVTFNYLLTVEAMTPDGPKMGSTVIQVSYGSQFNVNGGGRKGDTHVTGEALYLDLGQGKNLFVLLNNKGSGRPIKSWDRPLEFSNNAIYLPVYIFGFKWDWGNERSLSRQVRNVESTGSKQVPLTALPTVVSFSNLDDPNTITVIDPENLSAAIGEGYSLTTASLEIVKSRASTDRMRVLLRWLSNYPEPGVKTNRDAHRTLENEISHGDFLKFGGKL